MNISVIGTGYVGLTTGTCFAELGMKVMCMDTDKEKIDNLKKGIIPIYEPGMEEMVKKNQLNGNLIFTTELEKAMEFSNILFIAVGTPNRITNVPNLKYVNVAVKGIANYINDYKIIVMKSTVPVGTNKKIKKQISNILRLNNKNIDFDIVSNPEFLRQGSAIKDFMEPDRIVIGTDSEKAKGIIGELYNIDLFYDVPVIYTNNESAEMIKYVSNAYLATKISFINEIANMCERCEVDITVVARAMGLDSRIGPQFLKPGPGYGGSCFPKDTKALMHIGKHLGYEPKIIKAGIEVNEEQINIMMKKIQSMVKSFRNKTVTVLGIAFKPDTDDIRESPSIPIMKNLLCKNVFVKAYDPKAMNNSKKILSKVEYCSDIYTACSGSDCVVIVTDWPEFLNIDFVKLKGIVKTPNIIDLRNIFNPEKVKSEGFMYEGVGRK